MDPKSSYLKKILTNDERILCIKILSHLSTNPQIAYIFEL